MRYASPPAAVQAALLVPVAGLAFLAIFAFIRDGGPAVFGGLAAVCAALAAWVLATARRPQAWAWDLVAMPGLWLTTFLLSSNLRFLDVVAVVPLLLLARLACPALIIARAIVLSRRPQAANAAVAMAAILAAVTVADVAMLAVAAARPSPERPPLVFRGDVVPEQVGPADVAIVGDSFVYGAGVTEAEAFPAVMDGRWRAAGLPGAVLNLGVEGAGTAEYVEVLERVPRKRVAVVCFYMNDMPARRIASQRIIERLAVASRASGLARLVIDVVNLRRAGNVEAYLAGVIADYDPADPTFANRWSTLEARLEQLGQLAAAGASRRPLFVIFPLMWRFEVYPLRTTHTRIAQAAEVAGFQVLDMLPVFEREFPDGTLHRVAPGDNHFDAFAHRRTADAIFERLADR